MKITLEGRETDVKINKEEFVNKLALKYHILVTHSEFSLEYVINGYNEKFPVGWKYSISGFVVGEGD